MRAGNIKVVVLFRLGLLIAVSLGDVAWSWSLSHLWGRCADGQRNAKLSSGIHWLSGSLSRGRKWGRERKLRMKSHPLLTWDANSFVSSPELSHLDNLLFEDDHSVLVPIGMEQFSPLERVTLTACGTVQHIISAYYNKPVEVTVLNCSELERNKISRHVVLSVGKKEFCSAKSIVTVHNPQTIRGLQMNEIGLGQLIKYLGISPEFSLIGAGKSNERLWRIYEMQSSEIDCRVLETFVPNLHDLDLDC